MNAPTGTINIRGKEYQTVALRVQRFREDHPDFGLTTAVVSRDEECVVMQATITDADGRVLANGHAEEYRRSSQINRTSALENAETSAIGRALAALGYGGTEFASANEVQNAIHQQNQPAVNGADQGHSEESAVSPDGPTTPEKGKRVKLDGPYTSKTALWNAFKAFDRELRGCGDSDEFELLLLTPEAEALMKQCERDAPQLLEGGPDMPEEFTPLLALIEQRRVEFKREPNPADYLRAG